MEPNNYFLVDVFTQRAFGGNPLAVFPYAKEMTSDQMQRIASELNLSETTFVQAPINEGSDCTVRIFTPRRELPMAGHPTLGTAFVLHNLKHLKPKSPQQFIFDEGIGPVRVGFTEADVEPRTFSMHQPQPEFGEKLDRRAVATWLGLSPTDLAPDLPVQIVSCGVPYIMVPIGTLEGIRLASLNDAAAKEQLGERPSQEFLLFTHQTEQDGIDIHCRMFAPRFGVPEDPATGSAQGPLAGYLTKYGQATGRPLRSEQGVELGRPSQLTAEVVKENDVITGVIVSGQCVPMGEGRLYLDS